MEEKQIRARFEARHIAHLVPFMARNDIRYYLCGLCIEKAEQGGVYVIATDGHSMAVVYDATGMIEGADSVIISISNELIAAAKKAKTLAGIPQQVLLTGQRVRIAIDFECGGGEAFIQPGNSLVAGTFPSWRKVTPDFSKLKRGAFAGAEGVNAVYLARCAKLVGSKKKFCGLSFWQVAPRTAVVIQADAVPEMFVIIMPMSGEADEVQRVRFRPFVLLQAAEAAA